MKMQTMAFALTALLFAAACSSQPKESTPTPAPAATEPAAVPAPAPTAEAPQTDIQACEGKGAKDPCEYGDVKGACVRGDNYVLKCLPKKGKKK